MNRKVFFAAIRASLFNGSLAASQVDGITRILDYRAAKYPNMPDDELAYLLATVKWETASTMQPVTEYGSQKYLRGKRYWPWIGRGLIQITWKANYLKFGLTDPNEALQWDKALYVAFYGMVHGSFTGKKLSDYIGGGKRDYVGARRIINGTDKARNIATIAEKFRVAIEAALAAPQPAGPIQVEPDAPQLPKPASQSSTIWAQITQWVAGGGAAVLSAFTSIPWQTVAAIGVIICVGAGLWIIRERLLKRQEHGI